MQKESKSEQRSNKEEKLDLLEMSVSNESFQQVFDEFNDIEIVDHSQNPFQLVTLSDPIKN